MIIQVSWPNDSNHLVFIRRVSCIELGQAYLNAKLASPNSNRLNSTGLVSGQLYTITLYLDQLQWTCILACQSIKVQWNRQPSQFWAPKTSGQLIREREFATRNQFAADLWSASWSLLCNARRTNNNNNNWSRWSDLRKRPNRLA